MQVTQPPIRERKVSQFMTPDPISAKLTSSVREVAELLSEADIRHVPILHDERLVAVVSDRDMQVIANWCLNLKLDDTKSSPCIADFCDGEIITIYPNDNIADVIKIMIESKVGALPVVDPENNNLVGIVSYIDVLNELYDAIV